MVNIKIASQSDAKSVIRLIRHGVEEGALLPREAGELRSIIRKGNAVIAVDSGSPVGVGVLDFYSKRLSELRSLYVLPEYRKNGVGGRIIKKIFERASELGVRELMTITMRENKIWFMKRGFEEEAHGFKIALFREL